MMVVFILPSLVYIYLIKLVNNRNFISSELPVFTSADGLEQLMPGSNGTFRHVRLRTPMTAGYGTQNIHLQEVS